MPDGYTVIEGVVAGAFVLDGATPPPADLVRRAALSALEDGESGAPLNEGEALLFHGSTVERDGRTWYRFETLSSMPFCGVVAELYDGLVFDEA